MSLDINDFIVWISKIVSCETILYMEHCVYELLYIKQLCI